VIKVEGEPARVGRRASSIDFHGDKREQAVIRYERTLESTLERQWQLRRWARDCALQRSPTDGRRR
jgi:hypothetical protein